MNEDSWSGSGAQIISSGVTKFEYFLSRIIFGFLISILNLAIMLLVTQLLFFNVIDSLQVILLLAGLTAIISIGISGIVAGLIFLMGIEYGWLAWSALQFFILMSSPLAPIDVLPIQFQYIASVMPFTYLFSAVRSLVLGLEWQIYMSKILLSTITYLILGIIVYSFGFDYSRKSGKLARMF
jgi:ABC-type polysaccharide/polyol phosphate export permease